MKKKERRNTALTQSGLKEVITYNPDTGIFTNKVHRSRTSKKGDRPGWISDAGYHIIQIKGKNYRAHRLAFLYMEGYHPEKDVDHIDGHRTNNKWDNLREVSRSCNNVNCITRNSQTNYVTGVRKFGNSYTATISVGNKSKYLGCFPDYTEAVAHRLAAEQCLGRDSCVESSASKYMKKERCFK